MFVCLFRETAAALRPRLFAPVEDHSKTLPVDHRLRRAVGLRKQVLIRSSGEETEQSRRNIAVRDGTNKQTETRLDKQTSAHAGVVRYMQPRTATQPQRTRRRRVLCVRSRCVRKLGRGGDRAGRCEACSTGRYVCVLQHATRCCSRAAVKANMSVLLVVSDRRRVLRDKPDTNRTRR